MLFFGLLRNGSAQTPATVLVLSGTVSDPSTAKVPRAEVHIQGGSLTQDTTTDNAGRFTATLPAGTYDIVVAAPGFNTYARSVSLSVNSRPLDVRLTIATQSQSVEVVSDTAASTAAADNKSALVFKGSDLKTFSDDDTTFQQEIQSLAGGGGQGGADLYVDGFSGGRFPPKNTIREIRVNQNPFSPQYDGLGFNRIEIFTKPGEDKLHGSIFVLGNDNAFNARNPYTTVIPPGDSFLIQGELSGALNKKTSFSLFSNYINQQSAAVVNAPVNLDANGNAVNLSQTVSSPTTTRNYTLRLDRQVTPTNTLFSRYEYNSSSQTNSGVGLLVLASEGVASTTTQQTLQLGDTQTLGKNIVAETRFQYQRIRLDQTPNSTAPAVIVQGGFSGGGSPAGSLTDNQDHYEFQEYLSIAHGAHFIRAGGRYRLYRESNNSTANYNGTFTYNSLASYLATPSHTGASQFSITTGQSRATLLTGDLGLYVDDEWKLRKNVTLNLGLRFETQSAIPDHSDPAPRIGASWAIGQTTNASPTSSSARAPVSSISASRPPICSSPSVRTASRSSRTSYPTPLATPPTLRPLPATAPRSQRPTPSAPISAPPTRSSAASPLNALSASTASSRSTTSLPAATTSTTPST